MSYASGVDPAVTSQGEIRKIYEFLRAALRQVYVNHVFRGPTQLQEADFEYRNTFDRTFAAFYGTEVILYHGRLVYTLHYAGGILR